VTCGWVTANKEFINDGQIKDKSKHFLMNKIWNFLLIMNHRTIDYIRVPSIKCLQTIATW